MGKRLDLTGKRFGRLVALSLSDKPYINPKTSKKTYKWICKCDCGNTVEAFVAFLNDGRTNSCGCLGKENITRHGFSRTPLYKAHSAMKDRCNNDKNINYPSYGGRGISYDPKWEDFVGFWEDMGSSYEEGLTLDRIDVNGNYCKENCRWTDKSMQAFNRRIDDKNTSGKTGVSYAKNVDKWYAYIDFNGKRISLKLHKSYEDAVKAREEAELKYFGFIKE